VFFQTAMVGRRFLVAISFGFLAEALLSTRQLDELRVFYNQTNGEQWNWADLEPWDFSTDPCVDSWSGIQCNFTSTICEIEICGVTEMNLPNLGLENNLPSSFSAMSDLETLILNGNRLQGTIPTVLGELDHLIVLSLSSNLFSSSIPSHFHSLHQLQFLDLSSNKLTGTIPTELNFASFASTLTSLFLNNNHLNGSFPVLISSISHLQQLSLGHNSFAGPLPNSLCSKNMKLISFSLETNHFHGTLPSCLSSTLSQLKYFQLSDNSFHGPLPTFRHSMNMTILQANGNQFTSSIPSQYGELLQLQVLELGRNSLIGFIPTELCQLILLDTLYLHGNSLTGSIPQMIGQNKELEYFILFENRLTGTLPQSIGSLTKIREMVLHTNRLEGKIPNTLNLLTTLRIFLIQNNLFTEFMVSSIEMMTRLEPESEERVSQPVVFPYLNHLDISNNRFKGTLSNFPFSSFPNLKTFAAVENCFSGTLSSDICSPVGLEVSLLASSLSLLSFLS
jgi:hypothetical protein